MENSNEVDKMHVEIYDALKTVIDPEIGINIVDLGLVYKVEYSEDKGIQIDVTLSTKGCPMADIIMDNIHNTLMTKFPDKKLDIQLVWEPVWTSDFVTPAGKKTLGMTY